MTFNRLSRVSSLSRQSAATNNPKDLTMNEQPTLGQHQQQLQRQNITIKFKISNEGNATTPTSNYTFHYPLLKIDITIGECIRSIVEDPAFVGLFLNRYFINHRKVIVRYGNNMESTFHVRESEETLMGTNESTTTTATTRIASMNAMIGNVVVRRKSDVSTTNHTSTTMSMQD